MYLINKITTYWVDYLLFGFSFWTSYIYNSNRDWECNVLAETREPYISELDVLMKECHSCVKCNTTNTSILNLRSILDPSTVCCGCGCDCNCLKTLYTFEHVTRRLCFALNTKRNNILKTLPNNRRKSL